MRWILRDTRESFSKQYMIALDYCTTHSALFWFESKRYEKVPDRINYLFEEKRPTPDLLEALENCQQIIQDELELKLTLPQIYFFVELHTSLKFKDFWIEK